MFKTLVIADHRYARGGGASLYTVDLLKRLGISEEIKAKSRLEPSGTEVAEAVAKGETELGIGVASDVSLVADIESAALPAEVQSYSLYVAGITAASKQVDPAKALIGVTGTTWFSYLRRPAILHWPLERWFPVEQGTAVVVTGGGNDTIKLGGWGNNVDAGGGTNTIYGGLGNDVFVAPLPGKGIDTIFNFTATNGDVLDLRSTMAATAWPKSAAVIAHPTRW